MKRPSPIERYMAIRPPVRSPLELAAIVAVGILGLLFDWARLPFSPHSNIVGGLLLVVGLLIHGRGHQEHRQALDADEQIEALVTTGIFSKVRHPMYSSLILVYFGLAIAWGVAWTLLPAVLFSLITIGVASREEAVLLRQFGQQYRDYMRTVRWRFLPGIF